MSHILQPYRATSICFDAHNTNSQNFWIAGCNLHGTKFPCFVHGAQPFHRDNMVGCNQINNSFNIIISNMLTLLLFNKEHHNFFSNHSNCNIFLTIILFIFTFNLLFISMPTISSYVTIFPTIKAFYSIIKPRFKSWLWPIIEFNPIIRPCFYLCSYSSWKKIDLVRCLYANLLA